MRACGEMAAEVARGVRIRRQDGGEERDGDKRGVGTGSGDMGWYMAQGRQQVKDGGEWVARTGAQKIRGTQGGEWGEEDRRRRSTHLG